MRPRTASRVAWSLWIVTLVVAVAGIVLAIGNRMNPGDLVVGAIALVLGLGNATVGALIAPRHPRNPIGWLFGLVGIALLSAIVGSLYAVRGLLVAPGSLPAIEVISWFSNWLWFAGLAPIPLIFLLFPTGRPPGPRWRPVAWLIVAAALAGQVAAILRPGQFAFTFDNRTVRVTNPTGIDALGEIPGAVLVASAISLLLLAAASVAALLIRLRRSRGDEREQIKWLAFVAGLSFAMWVGMIVVGTFWGTPDENRLLEDVLFIAFFAALGLGIPAASAVAMLKYRLYDIDRVINKALVYGLLTALLGGAYATVVFGVGGLVSDNGVVVAAATLGAAALFRPLLRRIQGFIDRRFYRSRYDAARTVAAFGARLREGVELTTLSEELVGIVQTTVRPASAGLWLRTGTRNDPETPAG